MSWERVVARLLCGECVAGKQTVMAKIVETRDGIVLRASTRVPTYDHVGQRFVVRRHRYDDLRIDSLPPSTGWFGDTEGAARIGCPKHGMVVVTSEALSEVVDQFHADGRAVRWIIPHSG